jgi:Lysyl oxidase/Secretion system C-terminal sorting domain
MKRLFPFLALLFCISPLAAQPCGAGQTQVVVSIIPDTYPTETTWDLRDGSGNILASGGSVGQNVCVLNTLCLRFTIYDSYGDGICCGFGNGSYSVTYGGTLVASGGAFTNQEATDFGNCPPGSSCSSPIVIATGNHTAPTPDLWYSFTPSVTGQYYVHTCSSSCNTKIWVYDHCAGLIFDDNQTGTINYNDDNCGVQSEVFPQFVGGSTYYIRIGDNGTSCATTPIQWSLIYQGPITGCTDSTACNYNPLATVSDTCIYPGDPNCPDGPDLMVVQSALESSLTLGQTVASNCQVLEECLTGYGTRDIINFTTHIKNIGTQDYYIGVPGAGNPQFTFDNCHGHYHYVGYAEYVLYDSTGQALPVGFKNGFCVLDLECSGGGTFQYGCGNMGITAGCGDIYGAGLDCQWIDITDVPEGLYTLVVRVNWDQSPDALGRVETDFNNNWAQVCIRIDRTPFLAFSIEPSCPAYTDCNGVLFGSAQLDCNGVCDGTAMIGDYDQDTIIETADAASYADAIVAGTISAATCTDVNEDGAITVSDAVFIASCAEYGSGHAHAGGGTHDHCNFPTPQIDNPADSITLSIGNVDFLNHFVEIDMLNPDNEVIGFEFDMSGLVIDSVVSLINSTEFPCEMEWNAAGKVIGISYLDSAINRNTVAEPLCRIYYSGINSNLVCIDNFVDAINQSHENPERLTAGGCINSVSAEPGYYPDLGVKVTPNPFHDQTLVEFNQPHGVTQLSLLDLSGKVVRTYENIQKGRVVIYRDNLPSGMYLLNLEGEQNYAAKVVIF